MRAAPRRPSFESGWRHACSPLVRQYPRRRKISFRIDFVQEGDALFGNLWIAVDDEMRSHRRIPAAILQRRGRLDGGHCGVCARGERCSARSRSALGNRESLPDADPDSDVCRAATAGYHAYAAYRSHRFVDHPGADRGSRGCGWRLGDRGRSGLRLARCGGRGELRWNAGKLRGRAEVLYVPPVTVSVAGGDAVFHLVAARALLCVSVFDVGRLSLDGCAGLDAGQLAGTGTGQRVQNALTQHAAWLGAGLSAVPEIALTRAFSLELGAGLRVLGPTDHFVFRPGVTVHDVPRFSWDRTGHLHSSVLIEVSS